MSDERVIRVVAALVVDDQGRVLLVRKAGTSAFMHPGGKYGPGEGAQSALARELMEELDCAIDGVPQSLGQFTAAAANEPGYLVTADVFDVTLIGTPKACAEIAEIVWYESGRDVLNLAPLARECILPLLDRRGG